MSCASVPMLGLLGMVWTRPSTVRLDVVLGPSGSLPLSSASPGYGRLRVSLVIVTPPCAATVFVEIRFRMDSNGRKKDQ
ncbi:MAG: hypothetical protein J3R72DRAFT_433160 [Linnemannia gamsii]|nr:MAG: hypothetical protein J3R72DRAFT_433160 [Linnemannia gamsii]